MYMQWRVILLVGVKLSTYHNAGFKVKDAKISTKYTKLGGYTNLGLK